MFEFKRMEARRSSSEVTEFVIVLNSQAAVNAFARGGNVQFGGALSVAAGPVGRTAEAGVLPVAAVYTYSRSKGLFAGVAGRSRLSPANRKQFLFNHLSNSRRPDRVV